MEEQDERVRELHWKLVEEEDTQERAQIHLELGAMAVRAGGMQRAARHFREALTLDGGLEAARHALSGLGDLGERRLREGVLVGFLGRIRSRIAGRSQRRT